LSNSYYINGNILSLSSSIGGADKQCSGNYILSSVILPIGKISGVYSLSSSSSRSDNGNSDAVIKINGESYSTHSCDSNVKGCNYGNDVKSDSFEINFDSSKELSIEIITSKSTKGSSSANLELTFEEEIISNVLCGNSLIELGEQCDDGNLISDDGCSSTCQIEIVPPKLNWFQRLNLWIENFFKKLFGIK